MDDIDPQTDVKQPAGEEASEPESSADEQKAAEEAVEAPNQPEPTGEGDEAPEPAETEDVPKKGANARIRELNAKAKRAEEKASSLEQRLAELTGSGEPKAPSETPYTPQIEPGGEYSPDQFKQEVIKTADALVNLRVKQAEAIQRINTEATQVLRDYPELDPDSDSFDRELSESVTEAVEAHVKANPYSASVRKFADKLMKPYRRAVTKEVGKATETIAKQVSEAATRPTSVTAKGGKSAKDMTIEELEKELGVVY